MSKTASFVKFVAHPGSRAALLEALEAMLPAVEEEEGTELYALHTDRNDDNAVWLYELYTDEDALGAHGGTEAMKTLLGSLPALLAEPPLLVFASPVGAKGIEVGE